MKSDFLNHIDKVIPLTMNDVMKYELIPVMIHLL